ncbi:MAG: HXXEE domain-containing protein [Candidatus Limisoma sp.]
MELFYLALPIAFAVHDIEETAVCHRWTTTNSDRLATKFPRLRRIVDHLQRLDTRAFAIAALEEFLIIAAVTLCCYAGVTYAAEAWTALFLAFAVHLVVHLVQAGITRGYVPGLVSSITLLPAVGYACTKIAQTYDTTTLILLTIAGLIFAAANLLLSHKIGIRISARLSKRG